MALLEVKTRYATYTDCTLRVGQYQMDGSIAVEIISRREGPVARITRKASFSKRRTPDGGSAGERQMPHDVYGQPVARLSHALRHRRGRRSRLRNGSNGNVLCRY